MTTAYMYNRLGQMGCRFKRLQ